MNTVHTHVPRIRGTAQNVTTGSRRPHHQNKQWTASDGNRGGTGTTSHADGERWERGGGRGGRGRGRGRGLRKFPNQSLRNMATTRATVVAPAQEVNAYAEIEEEEMLDVQDDTNEENYPSDIEWSSNSQEFHVQGENASDFEFPEIIEPELTTQEERERFYQELVKAREAERKRAIAEGKMDDPLVPKRLEDAITMVGTCMDMCPRFERYRRERENNLTEWELIPGTKRVEHKRAVKMYERAAGDKTLPSDLRPPKVLKRTLDYLFHDLLPRGGFSATYTFIRDRSRAVRNDFTMQHESGPLAIECHDRCARFHILALHFERDQRGFSVALEEQQLMNTLQSLKEFYEEQRGRYESPTELEMRVYHRLIHIRDQKERHEEIPAHITEHPVFKLTTEFRLHVQAKSAPISKTSSLVVDAHGMEIFGKLANVLREQGSIVMIYLVACILERLFGKDTIENIEAIRGDLSIPDIIDGKAVYEGVNIETYEDHQDTETEIDEGQIEEYDVEDENQFEPIVAPQAKPAPTSVFGIPSNQSSFFSQTTQPPAPPAVEKSVFASLATTPSPFAPVNVFGGSTFPTSSSTKPVSVFGTSPFASTPFAPAPSASISATNYSAGKPSVSKFKSLSDAPALDDSVADTQEPTTTATLVFGIPSSSSPFGTTLSQPTGISLFGTPPTASLSSKPPPQSESNENIPSFFANPPKTSLNPAAPVFKPPVFSHTPPQKPISNGSSSTTPTVPPSQTSVFGDSSKKSSPTPPITRHSATPPLKIDTNWELPNPAPFSPVARALDSPIAPPLMKKPMPISLPSTPTANVSAVASNPFFNQLKGQGSLGPPGGPHSPGAGILSPLEMHSPSITSTSGLVNNFTPRQPLLKTISSFMLVDRLEKEKGKGKGVESPTPKPSSARANVSGFFASTSTSTPTSTSTSTLMKTSPLKSTPVKYNFDIPSREEMGIMSKEFEEKTVMKRCWMNWKKRFAGVKKWLEAVEHSDAYRVKKEMSLSLSMPLSKSRFSQSQGSGSGSAPLALSLRGRNKLSMSVGELDSDRSWNSSREGSPSKSLRGKKRSRKRISDYNEPRTDEEIARRLKENREQNEKRWAQGSYLEIIRSHVQNKLGSLSHSQSFSHSLSHETQTRRHNRPWNIWLSLNPDNDSTAIWLERKFNMPDSGKWSSETVFSIPLFQEDLKDGDNMYVDWNPGLIMFECTPTDGVNDEIEKKYRILDDCSRLRDILEGLSPKRHYIPSLLVLNWANGEHAELSVDLVQTIQKYLDDSTIAGFMSLGITTTANLDEVLEAALQRLKLDVEGKLVKSTTVRGIFKTFEEEFSIFLLEWFDNCSINGYFDWYLYGHLIQATIGLLNKMASLVSAMLSKTKREVIPTLDITDMRDSDSAYDTVITWLSWIATDGDTERIIMDLQSHININTAFPARTFIEHLLELTVIRTEKHTSIPSHEKLYIPHIDLKASSELFESAIQPYQTNLGQALNKSLRRSPKRRGISEETEDQDLMSPEAKRLKLGHTPSLTSTIAATTPPTTPLMNGNGNNHGRIHSRSPSVVSLGNTETPDVSQVFEGSGDVTTPTRTAPSTPTPSNGQVTIAMLRALARDVKKKYASPGKVLPMP